MRGFGSGQGGEAGASPQRAVTVEPTLDRGKRPTARRVFGEKAVWLRCSSVEDPQGIFSFIAPRHTAFSTKTAPLVVFKPALRTEKVCFIDLEGQNSFIFQFITPGFSHEVNRVFFEEGCDPGVIKSG